MLSKLDQFQILLAMDASYMPSEYGRDIYHYTSPIGFMSILFGNPNNAMLWASRYDCLNDMSEGSVVEEILHEVCDDMLSQGEFTKELHQLFSAVKPARTILLPHYEGDALRITRPECDRYVCSFSKNDDSLAMWNYYSKGSKYEGFSIGFFPSGIETSLKSFLHGKEAAFHIYPVIYDKTVVEGDGMLYVGCGFLITIIPLLIMGVFGRYYYKINYFKLMGLLAGSTTDPPALAYASQVTGSNAPAVGYSTVYPVTMFLRILTAQLLILILAS